jgi:ABC-type sugar transport system substrate-binding protein
MKSAIDRAIDAGIPVITIQGDLFSQAILNDSPVPVPLENALGNMAVIDALFRSGETGRWEIPAVS